MELWMGTKNYYPAYTGYQMSMEELTPGVGLLKAVVLKTLFQMGQVLQVFPQIAASWILAFFLPCLFFRYSDPAANVLRRITLFCLLGILIGVVVFPLQMPMFVAVVPAMLVFSVGYLMHLIQQAQLDRRATAILALILGAAILYPLFSTTMLQDRPTALPDIAAAQAMGKRAGPNEASLSDQPWIPAWYADRPSIWIPRSDVRMSSVRQQFTNMRWLFLTTRIRDYSIEWQYIYRVLNQWSLATETAREKKMTPPQSIEIQSRQSPLSQALDGFTSVDLGSGSSATTVVATLPRTTSASGEEPSGNKAVSNTSRPIVR
jgi:hypothetical protein